MEAKHEVSRFFSLEKLFWAFIYDMILVGVLASWIFFQVKVMGNDVAVGEPRTSYSTKR